jgi:hypothetical protein
MDLFCIKTLKNFDKVNGTSLVGTLNVNYDDLVELFGEPMAGYDYKTDAEWALELCFHGGESHVVTIYNWKNGKNYLGKDGLDVDKITRWNVGGHSVKSHQLLSNAIRTMLRK